MLEMLADSAIRERVGVSTSNKFLFAYTDASSDGAVGYNDIRHLCVQLDIKIITATGMHHRASTALWGMSISESQIDGFMEHLGHQNHACPPVQDELEAIVDNEMVDSEMRLRMHMMKTLTLNP